MSETKTKSELLSEMRELQQEYSKRAAILKEMTFNDEKADYEKRQLERLEQYKAKYKFYANSKGEAKPIDWEEVEKLIRSSFETYGQRGSGYYLGFDQTGVEGLGCDYGTGGTFSPMVEEESDARKYAEREARRQEFIERSKTQKR